MPDSPPTVAAASRHDARASEGTTPARPHGARAEYDRRLEARRAAVARDTRLDNRFARWRGYCFVATLVVLIVSLTDDDTSPWWTVLPAALFGLMIAVHERVAARLVRARRATTLYEAGLARLDDRWRSSGATGERYADPEHPYTDDLDVFGSGSLFQLICHARTRLGEDTLAGWLRAPADPGTIRRRQEAVGELRGGLDFREELALLEQEVGVDLDQNHLLRWAARPLEPVPVWQRALITALSAATIAALVYFVLTDVHTPLLVGLALLGCFAIAFGGRIRETAAGLDRIDSGLTILARVLQLLEDRRFETPLLHDLRRRLDTDGVPPSRRIRHIDALVRYLDNSLRNQFFAPFGFVLGLPVHLLHAIQVWHERYAARIAGWLGAVGEFEAISSLAEYAYERPEDPFPEIVEAGPLFDGKALGHPLLPEAACIRNDVALGGERRLMLVSGSNMSGKSTLLRTVGTNVVLALMGAPVRARRLRVSPLQIGSAMRVGDSLQDGKSLFYAVVGRLKQVVDLTGRPLPLLFLLDEILQGTNSHDRRVGAEGIIRRLVERGAIGLVTTHDLALTEIVPTLGGKAINVHFEDHLADGRMTFDYTLRPGVVERSNALELMRMMGLEV